MGAQERETLLRRLPLLLLLAAPPLLFLSSFHVGTPRPLWSPPAAATSAPPDPPLNFTATLVSRWLSAGTEPCHTTATSNVSIPGLDGPVTPVELLAGPVHEFAFFSLDELGRRRCASGDYFEADLTGPRWKARPGIADHGDGSYTLRFRVDPEFSGEYNLTLVLLFRDFQGLRFSTQRFALRRPLRQFPLLFRPGTPPSPPLRRCTPVDFQRPAWSGRWTRHSDTNVCEPDPDGRYRCLPAATPCPSPWCGGGDLAALESHGWVYSAHCAFSIYSPAAAWQCLSGKWLFFWGDSNHVDTIRNLLTFVLGVPPETAAAVRRRFDRQFVNPGNTSQWVRITNVFNGHWNETGNYEGLASLRHPGFRNLTRSYFEEPGGGRPDAVVLNSGLHDGIYWRSLRKFVAAADDAAAFWENILTDQRHDGRPKSTVFYRTTVAAGGYARELSFNPQKMEAFNGIMVEKLGARGVLTGGVIDHFDMTFPWHWDNRCNDGVHYGRAPARARWRDGLIGHHYFVDLMLVHVILTAVCPND